MSSKVSLAMRLSSPSSEHDGWDSKRTANDAFAHAGSSTRTPSPSPARRGAVRASATPSPSLLSRLQGPSSPLRLVDRIQKPDHDEHVSPRPLAQRLGLTLDETSGASPPVNGPAEDHPEPLQMDQNPIIHSESDQRNGVLVGGADVGPTPQITAPSPQPPIQIFENAIEDSNAKLPGSQATSPDSEASVFGHLHVTGSPAEVDDMQRDRGFFVVPTDTDDTLPSPCVAPAPDPTERPEAPPNDPVNAPPDVPAAADVHVTLVECPEVPTAAEDQNPSINAECASTPRTIPPDGRLNSPSTPSGIDGPIASSDVNNASGATPMNDAAPTTPANTDTSVEYLDLSASDIMDMVLDTPPVDCQTPLPPASSDIPHTPTSHVTPPDEFTNAPSTREVSLNYSPESSPLHVISETISLSSSVIPPPSPHSYDPSSIEQCRAALVPVILRNASRRRIRPNRSLTADDVRALLTDDRCLEFIAKAELVQGQLALRSREDVAKNAAAHDDGISIDQNDMVQTQSELPSSSQAPQRPAPPPPPPPPPVIPTVPTSSSPKVPVAMLKRYPSFHISDDPSLLVATPMRETYSRDPRIQYSPTLEYGDGADGRPSPSDSPPRRPSLSTPQQQQQPQSKRGEARSALGGADPVAVASDHRGTKRSRRTSVDDVHSTTPLQPLLHSTPPPSSQHASPVQTAAGPSDSPQLPVPGLWLAKVGLPEPDIIDVTLDIDGDILDHSSCASDPVVLHLICLSTRTVSETYAALHESASSADIANAMWSIKTAWPLGGKLVVNVNHEESWGRSFLPLDLTRGGPAIDVTRHLRPGLKNRLRFIHLGDLSAYTFVLHASRAPRTPVAKNTTMTAQEDSAKVGEYVTHVRVATAAGGGQQHASTFSFGPKVT